MAVIECLQPIPCNPCEGACNFGAIHVGTPIINLPVLNEEKCTGCGMCITRCPGLAIFVVDKSYMEGFATVSFPHEYLPLPVKGQMVDAVNRSGEVKCKAEVLRINNAVSNDHTPVVTVIVPLELADTVRGMKRLEQTYEKDHMCENITVSLDDPDDTLVCRCEEVTIGDIKRAILDGAQTLTGVKRRTRAGMGLCQGRTCQRLVERMLIEALGCRGAEIEPDTVRPPMKPVKVGVLEGNAMNSPTDVVVIGGGMQGLSTAYFLLKRGKSVTVIERGDLAQGTTSRSDGDIFVCDSTPGYFTHLQKAAVNEIIALTHEIDDFDWMSKGCVILAENEAQVEIAKKQYQEKLADGIRVRFMDQYEVHEDEPNTAPDIPGGLEFPDGGSLNPMLFAYALGREIRRMDGKLLRFTTVLGIGKDEKGAVNRVITDMGDIFCGEVVIAAGVWSPEIGRMAGIDIPITAMKGDLLVLEPNVYITRRKTMDIGYSLLRHKKAGNDDEATFEQAHGIGFLIEPTNEKNALIGFSKYPVAGTKSDFGVMRAMARRAFRFFPIIKDMNVIRAYAGIRPWTSDHEAIVSRTNVPGLYVNAGHAGDGIKLAPISGKMMSQLICGEKTDFDLAPLRLDRFQTI